MMANFWKLLTEPKIQNPIAKKKVQGVSTILDTKLKRKSLRLEFRTLKKELKIICQTEWSSACLDN